MWVTPISPIQFQFNSVQKLKINSMQKLKFEPLKPFFEPHFVGAKILTLLLTSKNCQNKTVCLIEKC